MRVAMLVLLGLLAVPSLEAAAAARHDSEVARDVEKAVLGSVHYGVFDSVGVEVHDGQVRLQGSVRRGIARRELEKRVAKVAGVRGVTNAIRVQSASVGDERLRLQLYRSIYWGDTLLPHAALSAPVRILVDRGRVTLTGYVNSRVEQVKVGIKARETWAFAVDNQVKLESERHAEESRI